MSVLWQLPDRGKSDGWNLLRPFIVFVYRCWLFLDFSVFGCLVATSMGVPTRTGTPHVFNSRVLRPQSWHPPSPPDQVLMRFHSESRTETPFCWGCMSPMSHLTQQPSWNRHLTSNENKNWDYFGGLMVTSVSRVSVKHCFRLLHFPESVF